MKNIILFVLINFVSFGYANSQTRERYVFDNFETKAGVRVLDNPTQASLPTPSEPLVEKTKPLANNSASLKNNPKPVVKLVEKTVMSSAAGKSLAAFSTGDATIDSYIAESSARYNIDPLLIFAQMHQESGFKRRATSYKGASGLMQLMPATAMRFGVTNIYDPKQNIEAGVRYMRWLLDKFGGDVHLALAGYNAGEGAVMKYGNQIPPYSETQAYVKRISGHYNSIKKPSSQKAVNKPSIQKVAKSEQQPASSPKFEQSLTTGRLANGKKGLTNL